MDERVIGLLDVHLTFALVWGHRTALHGHLASTKLHQVLAGGASRARHHAGEQSSRRHDEELLEGQVGLNTRTEYITVYVLQICGKHITSTYL